METGRKVYQGSGGTPLLETHRCYNGATGDCTNSEFYLPVAEIDETRSMNGASPTRTVTYYNSAHLPTEVDEYDFGGSSILRKTLTSYASLGNNIADRPSNIVVKDGGGSTVKQTNFSYDQFSLATPNGSTPNLVSVSGARGNLTQKDEWTGSGYISTYYHYDAAGQLISETDPRGNTTSYLYDDATDTVIKSIARPDTNNGSTHHVTTFTINPNTLVADAKVDENGIHTDYVYDTMLRNTVVKSAEGTSAENWQSINPSATQTVSKQDLNSINDQALVSTVNMDSYCRKRC
jgi:hypothetical protein